MKSLLFYLLQVIVASGILYGYYHLMLRNKKFHQYNRFYLLGSIAISIFIPFLRIPLYFTESETKGSFVLQTLQNISFSAQEKDVIVPGALSPAVSTPFDWNIILYIFYILAALVLLARVLISLKKIKRIIKNNTAEELNGVHFVNTAEPDTPYSFFRWLFWNNKIELRSEKGEQIFRHEIFHIRQKHSLDILFMEFLSVIFWINPFFHLVKKELKAIHEFLADRFAIQETAKWEYAELLLMQVLNTRHQLVNPFFHNQIKRRIAMITNPQKTSYKYMRKLLVLPVAAILVTLFAFNYKNRNADLTVRSENPITIIIDAGHGGIDPGAISIDHKYTEAQLTLEIAKKIQKLAGEYNIKVVMTREDDQLPGNAATKEDGLKMRVAISEITKPDAFISIHLNADEQKAAAKKGFEAYIAGQKEDQVSRTLASAILQNISSIYPVNTTPLQRHETGIYVLDKNNFPSLILECGYITNADDLDFILKPDNQEKLARNILATVVKYKNETWQMAATTSMDTLPRPFVTKAMVFNRSNKVILTADTVLFSPRGDYKDLMDDNKELVLINNKKYDPSIIQAKTITSRRITFYSKNDPEAIELFGKEAINGAIVFEDATIIDTPPSATYKKYLLTIEKSKVDIKVYDKTEIEPVFRGGEGAWEKYLAKNFNASVPMEKGAPAGTYTAYIQFVVYKDGSISDIKPLTHHGFGMEEEAMRVISKGPKWLPGIHNGRAVNTFKKQPITFVVKKNDKTSQITREDNNTAIKDYSNPANWDYSDPEFRKWRQKAVSEVIAIAKTEEKAAYEYKGRTYIFAKINKADPDVNTFAELDGIHHSFLLNGRLISSIEEINNSYTREDIRTISVIPGEESKRKYNIDKLFSIETADNTLMTKN